MKNLTLLRRYACMLLVCSAGALAADDASTPVVEVAPVTVAAISPKVRAPGTVVSTLDAKVAAEVSGRLLKVAEIGEKVKKGQAVAVIDDHVWRLQREADVATIRRLQASLAYLDRQQQRLSQLTSEGNVPRAELDELHAKRDMVAEEIEAAKAELARTEYDLGRTKLLAPFDGVVAGRLRVAGEYITAGKSVVRLVDTASLEVTAQAPISVTRYNREGAMVEVTGDFGSALLPIRSLVPVGDVQSRQIEVRLAVHGLDWVIGEPVEVALSSGPRTESVAVPRAALVRRKSSAYVFRVDEGRIAHKVTVQPYDDEGEMVTVRGELQPNDSVVVLGGERLRDGQKVSVRERVALR